MEAAEVDQRIGAQVEVGDDGCDGVQLGWQEVTQENIWFSYLRQAAMLKPFLLAKLLSHSNYSMCSYLNISEMICNRIIPLINSGDYWEESLETYISSWFICVIKIMNYSNN